MAYNSFRFNIFLRVIFLTITLFLFSYLVNNDSILIGLFMLILSGFQVLSLMLYINKANRELIDFIDSIKDEDLSKISESAAESSEVLKTEFRHVLRKMQEVGAEKEAHYQYLKNIVQHLGIGILTFNKEGEIQIINTAAKRLFGITQLRNVKSLKTLSPILVDSFFRLKTGGRDLVKIENDGEIIQLAVYAIELSLKNEEFKLISVQNIQSELEEKEMEAWQNLIRVLTHEIMNSVTPISSLAATVDQELVSQLENGQEVNEIPNDELTDLHLAVQTIHNRSEGLIRFVSDFRNLTKIPVPRIKNVSVADLFQRIEVLFRNDMKATSISLDVQLGEDDLEIKADQELIEQVLINLVKNAIQALEDEEKIDKKITLQAYAERKNHVIIKVADNGPGIDEEALEKLFIPFFTTKKNGSGIGLSISRQIMRQHKAVISAASENHKGTEFTLKF